MLQLLKAPVEDILRVGLTVSQVFYVVGRQTSKKLCRFIKTDSLTTAISTLLAVNGKRRQVQDIRLADGTGLKVWTDKGIEYLPGAEINAFLSRYNKLAREGCKGECNCAQDSTEMWKKYCIHRIAQHLASVKEKLEVAAQTVKDVAASASFLTLKINQLVNEAKYQISQQNLVWFEETDWGDVLLEVRQYNKVLLGHLIITSEAELKVVPARAGATEENCATAIGAIARLTSP